MAKLTLTDISAGYISVATYNANNTLLETALENTLSRDGTSPNTMSAVLDMNSNKITNLTDGTNNQDAVTKAQLDAAVVVGVGTLDDMEDTTITGAAKGDILAYNGTAWVDLTVGADGLVLTAASGEATGLQWASSGAGDVTKVATPANNELAIWTGDGTLEGESNITYDGTTLTLLGGKTLTINDGTNADTISISHDGTDANVVVASTTALNFTGASSGTGYTFDQGIKIEDGSLTIDNDVTGGSITFSVADTERLTMNYFDATANIDVSGQSSVNELKIVNGSIDLLTINATDGVRFYGNGQDTHYTGVDYDGTNFLWSTSTGLHDWNDVTHQDIVFGDVAYESTSEVVSANAFTVTVSEGPGFEVDLEAATAAVTGTISGGPTSGDYGVISVKVEQDSSSAQTLTWAGGTMRWPDGTAHPVTTTVGGFTLYTFETWDGGTIWYGSGADYS